MKSRILTLAAVLFIGQPAFGQIIYENISPGINPSSGYGASAPDSSSGYGDVAVQFTAGASLFAGRLELPLFASLGDSTATLTLLSDNANAPGAVLESAAVSSLSGYTGMPSLTTVEFAGTTLLDAGDVYWLALTVDIELATWVSSFLPGLVVRDFESGFSVPPEPGFMGDAPAFRLWGAPPSTMTPMPEPSTYGVLALCGLGLVILRRRWLRRATQQV